MLRALMWIALALCVLIGLAVGALIFLASRAEPLPGIDQAIASLPESERQALEAFATSAGIKARDLRPIGGYYEGILDHEANQRAVWIDAGHVRLLRLRDWPQAGAPELGAFPELEVLWLDHGRLTEWPDLSGNPALSDVNFSHSSLGQIEAARLPAALTTLRVDHTAIADLQALANASNLKTLDASHTAVSDISALVPLALDRLVLTGTQLASLPATRPQPRHGDWSMNIDDTPLLNRPGLSWQGPGGYSFVNTALGNETREGGVSSSTVDARGTGSEVPALRPVQLLTRSQRGNIYEVEVTARIETGRARIWLDRPDRYFRDLSPWFGQVDIDGFGFLSRNAWVYADFSAGETITLQGRLMNPGSPDHPQMQFLIEPLDGSRVTGLSYAVRAAEGATP